MRTSLSAHPRMRCSAPKCHRVEKKRAPEDALKIAGELFYAMWPRRHGSRSSATPDMKFTISRRP